MSVSSPKFCVLNLLISLTFQSFIYEFIQISRYITSSLFSTKFRETVLVVFSLY